MNNFYEYEVSVIIPVYNVDDYIEECIESVINQNNSKIQIIIVNDGSVDNSDNIIQKYLKENKNIVYINQNNQGLSMSRNNGIKHMKGEYTMFLDGDDYLEENSIDELYKYTKKLGSDISIFGYRKVYDDNISFDKVNSNFYENKLYKGNTIINNMLSGNLQGYAWNKIFKSEFIIKNNLSFEKGVYFEDFFPIFRLIQSCNKVSFYNKVVYNYRQRISSITSTKNQKLLNDFILCRDNVLKYITKNKININKDCLNAYKIESFNYILTIFYDINKRKKRLYKNFYNFNYKKYEVSLIDVLLNKYINKKTKLAIILWKMRIYHILMPILRRVQNNIRLNKGIDI